MGGRFFLPLLYLLLLVVSQARSAVNPQLAYDDAKVIRRVLEVSGKSVPREVIERIAKQDLDLLRGRRADDTYEYASYQREEASRETEDFTVGPKAKATKQSIKADYAYQLLLTAPTRRYVVRRNNRVFVERIVLELTPFNGQTKYETIEVGDWIEPGKSKAIDLPDIERRATATVFANVDEKISSSALDLALLQAKIVDAPDSPFALSVRNLKLILDAMKRDDTSNLNSLAQLILADLGKRSDVSSGMVIAAPPATPPPAAPQVVAAPIVTSAPAAPPRAPETAGLEAMPNVEVYMELQSIEDLLTGTEAERREGMDKLHQLLRKLR